jgi:hypothetical protein
LTLALMTEKKRIARGILAASGLIMMRLCGREPGQDMGQMSQFSGA